MEPQKLALILKALLLAAGEPLSVERLQRCFAHAEQPTAGDIRAALEWLGETPDEVLTLTRVAGGWRLQVDGRYAPWIDRLWEERPPRYSRALLETLALIVYRQPVTRGEIEEVRGVSLSQSIIRTLSERGWVRVVGHREIPGRPALFGTTAVFLADFNLNSLDQLPSLPEVRDEQSLDRAVTMLHGGAAAEASAGGEHEQ